MTTLIVAHDGQNQWLGDEHLTPLHVAASSGDEDVVKELLNQGENCNAKDVHEITPLHFAAYKGHLKIAQLLIDSGADVTALEENGMTPQDIAVCRGNQEIVDLLSKVARAR